MARNPRRERLFIGSIAFLVTAVLIRLLTLAIRFNLGPFHNVSVGGTHVHHLVWGILLLLVVGYLSLIELGTGDPAEHLASRLTAVAFGIGAALTLDEFALWLNLKDVYWERQGKESIEAILIFLGVLSVGLWGAPLIRAVMRGEHAAVGELEHLGHEFTHHGQQAPPADDQPNHQDQTPV
jgi:hypothetical protein